MGNEQSLPPPENNDVDQDYARSNDIYAQQIQSYIDKEDDYVYRDFSTDDEIPIDPMHIQMFKNLNGILQDRLNNFIIEHNNHRPRVSRLDRVINQMKFEASDIQIQDKMTPEDCQKIRDTIQGLEKKTFPKINQEAKKIEDHNYYQKISLTKKETLQKPNYLGQRSFFKEISKID